jgi:tRNA(Ile)-lysidine synthase TilS/MesJ
MQFFSREFPVELRTDVGLQENARDWRRRECLQIVNQLESDALKRNLKNEQVTGTRYVICTAHTRDDQMETLMMKLIRGVHISNFHGVRFFYHAFCAESIPLRPRALHLFCL